MSFSIAHSTASNFEHNLFSRRARGLRSAPMLWIFEMPTNVHGLVIFNFTYLAYKDDSMTDRRPLNPNVTVPKPGGGVQPRSRNQDGQVRDKRDDAGKPRKK